MMPTARSEKEENHGKEREHLLALRLKDGDRQAFAELVGLYQKRLFVFAYGFFPNRDDALEIVQEAFMRIWAKIGGYEPRQSFSGWVYRLTHNLCIDTYRKYHKKRILESNLADVAEKKLAVTDSPQQALESQQLSAAVARAAARLSLKQKSVFTMKYVQGMKLQQVAEVMNISLGTVKTLHHRALRKIRNEVGAGARGEHGTLS